MNENATDFGDAGQTIPANVIRNRDGVPLTSLAARPIIQYLFNRTPQWRRQDLAAEVEKIHFQHGGVKGKQDTLMVVKKALHHLAEEGVITSVPNGFGLWRSTGAQYGDEQTAEARSQEEPGGSEEADDLQVLDQIGEGTEAVYLYFSPNDRRLAELEERDEWECKIGHTQGPVAARILGQGAKTALSHTPIVGLVIRTPDSAALERAIHAALRLAHQTVEDSPGAEWFLTSPAKVMVWYESFEQSLNHLKTGEKGQQAIAPDARGPRAGE